MSRKKWERLAATLVAAVFLLILSRVSAAPVSAPDDIPPPTPLLREEMGDSTSTNAYVSRAVDGDTLEAALDDGTEVKIRMLGVNTPESVDPRRPVECFGKEASKHTAELVAGKRVLLRADPQADEVDRYGRLLRNVYLEDGTDVNAVLVRDGYAYAYLDYPLNKQRKVELARLQDEAEAAQRGLWNPDACNGVK
ncbi:thermonuclease family protein [Patescibacteria group bacterium]|nr:thermonuclease family protein [Patescibacteria group bacterium]